MSLHCSAVSSPPAATGIRRAALTSETNLPRPSRILVHDFAVSEQEVKEYQGIMRQQPTIKDASERERLLAKDVKDALAEEVVDGLKSLGFAVERVGREAKVTGSDLLIDGQFLNRWEQREKRFSTGGNRDNRGNCFKENSVSSVCSC